MPAQLGIGIISAGTEYLSVTSFPRWGLPACTKECGPWRVAGTVPPGGQAEARRRVGRSLCTADARFALPVGLTIHGRLCRFRFRVAVEHLSGSHHRSKPLLMSSPVPERLVPGRGSSVRRTAAPSVLADGSPPAILLIRKLVSRSIDVPRHSSGPRASGGTGAGTSFPHVCLKKSYSTSVKSRRGLPL